jgi:hypothetical protein
VLHWLATLAHSDEARKKIGGTEQKCYSNLARLLLAWMPRAPLLRCLLAAAPSATPLRRAACGLPADHQHLPASLGSWLLAPAGHELSECRFPLTRRLPVRSRRQLGMESRSRCKGNLG